MPSIGPMELIVVLVIALLVLGPKRLPTAGRALGEGLRGFKESVTGEGASRDELAPSETTAAPVE
jgi:sec-independent protein translocase protein TatA